MVSANCAADAASGVQGARGLIIGSIIHLPNSVWAGWLTGTSICRIEGFVSSLPVVGKKRKQGGGGPAFVVRTLEDSHCYPFNPSELAKAVREGSEIMRAESLAQPEWASMVATAAPAAPPPPPTLPPSASPPPALERTRQEAQDETVPALAVVVAIAHGPDADGIGHTSPPGDVAAEAEVEAWLDGSNPYVPEAVD